MTGLLAAPHSEKGNSEFVGRLNAVPGVLYPANKGMHAGL
jgi:hypothetical protein